MPTARAGLGAAVLGGKIHAVGGRLGGAPLNGPGLATHEIFDPGPGTWAPGPPMPTPMGDVYATTSLAGRMYVVGGWDGFTNTAFNQIFDAGAGAWAPGAPMPTPRSNAIAGALGGRVFVIGGIDDNSSNLTAVEAYDPVFDAWCTGPSKPRAASELASTGVTTGNAIHAIGSGFFGANLNFHEALVLVKVDCACPRTQGFWKNHSDDWPVGSLMLGAETYTQAELLDLLKKPVKGDASRILAKQLIAAKLNFAAGADRPDAVTQAILDADALLASFAGTLPYGVKSSSPAGQAMTTLASLLDDFNNGELTPDCP